MPNSTLPEYEMLVLDMTPMGAPRMTQRDKWKKRPVVERYHAFRDEIRLRTAGYELPDFLTARFVIPFPKSYGKLKRFMLDGKPHGEKPDIDNICKAVMDALKPDDKTLHTLNVTKVWGEAGSIEITMRKK